jgi:uncharacterized protein YcbX
MEREGTKTTHRNRGTGVEFDIGDVTHPGIAWKPRCVVPTRDPETGEPRADSASRFAERREESFADWTDEATLGTNMDRGGGED